jgi:putative membrane protein
MRTHATLVLVIVLAAGCAGRHRRSTASSAVTATSDTAFIQYSGMRARGGIEVSDIASRGAVSPQVRDLARSIGADQHEILNSANVLASRRNVTVPTEPDTAHSRAAQRLLSLRGENLDQEYIALLRDELERDLALYQHASKAAESRAVRKAASEAHAIAQRDLDAVQSLSTRADNR